MVDYSQILITPQQKRRRTQMAVQFPEGMEVICDQCGDDTMMEVASFMGNMCGVDNETLESYGWTHDGEDTYCPECSRGRDTD
jgi:hypothetical protein